MPIHTAISEVVEAPLEATFTAATSIDPRKLITKHGPLPAITHVDGHEAPWSAAGQARTYGFSDQSSVREELTVFTQDFTFAYRLDDFTNLFRHLAREVNAEWHFTMRRADRTRIDWVYTFTPRNFLTHWPLWFVVKLFWPGYLRKGLKQVRMKAENTPPPVKAEA
ncbi:MAG: hypothetical protein AAGB02_02620 [Pseudomonadota bacterium]